MPAPCAIICLGTDPNPASLGSLQDQRTDCTVFVAHQARTQEAQALDETTGAMRIARWKFFRPISFAERMNRLLSLAFTRWEHEDLNTCFICFLDGDAVLAPGALDTAIDILRTDMTLGGVCPVLLDRVSLQNDDMDQRVFENTDRVQSAGYTLTGQRTWVPLYAGADVHEVPIVPAYVFGGDGRCAVFRASVLYRACVQNQLFFSWILPEHAWFELYWRLRWMGERFLCSPHVHGWMYTRPVSARDRARTVWMTRSVRALHDPFALRMRTVPTLMYRSMRVLLKVIVHPSCLLVWVRSWSDVVPRFRFYHALRQLHRVSTLVAKSWFTEQKTS